MQPITIDYSRVQEVTQKAEERLNQIKAFIEVRTTSLEVSKPQIEQFLKLTGTKLELGNMYSTGGSIDPDYTSECSLLVNGTLELKSIPAENRRDNMAEKLSKIWSENVPTIKAEFHGYKIKGNIVSFKLWI